MALSNDLSRALVWMFSRGGFKAQAFCKSGKSLCLTQGKLSPPHEGQSRFMGHVQGPSCLCLAVEPSVSLQTNTAWCYTLCYYVAKKPSNPVDGLLLVTRSIFQILLCPFFVSSWFLDLCHSSPIEININIT